MDLSLGTVLATVPHDSIINWLEVYTTIQPMLLFSISFTSLIMVLQISTMIFIRAVNEGGQAVNPL